MRRSLLVPVVVVTAVLVAGCESSTVGAVRSAVPRPTTAAPSFDTISIDITQGGTGTAVVYDLDKGSTMMDSDASTTRQGYPRTPFQLEVTKPHGPRDIRVLTIPFSSGMAPASCTIRINGKVVAADTGTDASDGVDCAYVGTP